MLQLDGSLLQVHRLRVDFATADGIVHAVRGMSYGVAHGEALGIVGESGSGKSVSQLALMGLLPDTATVLAKNMVFADRELMHMQEAGRRKLRGKHLAMIFQDPMTSLNPFLTLGTQIAEMFRLHQGLRGAELERATVHALAQVGIPKPELRVEQYPHEFSGGMRQRAMIAMMLAGKPDLLIADEPTTALDVTVQAQILTLLKKLQRERGMGIIFITHDLGVIAGFAQRVLVMYAGRIVEQATTEVLFRQPEHPYTRGLLGSVPRLDTEVEALDQIPGQPPDLSRLTGGCPFAERCAYAEGRCEAHEPELRMKGEGHGVACHVDLPPYWEETQ